MKVIVDIPSRPARPTAAGFSHSGRRAQPFCGLGRCSCTALTLLVLPVSGAWFSAMAATVTRGPYLQMGTPDSIVVRWRSDAATDSRVRFGSSPGSLTRTADNPVATTEHEVRLTWLTPDTQYYYSVGAAATTLAGGDSTFYFVTFPAPGAAAATRVWVLGDSGTASSDAEAVRDAYYNFTGARHTDLWLMLGDNAYGSGDDDEYQEAVFDMYPTMLRQSVLFPALGNHDDGGDMFDIFTLPANGECGGLASGTENYFGFNRGNIHFICLDSNGGLSSSGTMANWLRSDLAATAAEWIIAFFHHPPYSKGSHDSDSDDELVEMRQNIMPILEAGGVDLVLAGHSHSYERSYFLRGHYGNSDTFNHAYVVDGGSGRGSTPYRKQANGTAYVVAGSSGHTSGGDLNHPAMFVSLDELGSLVLELANDRLEVQFLDADGAVRDNFAITKAPGSPPPSAPTGLAAVAGQNQVALNWMASANATGYKVKRSTSSGGPYAIRAVSVSGTSFTDNGASSGATYYYVVSAVNSAGESPNSSEASATPLPPSGTGTFRFSAAGYQVSESAATARLTVLRVNGAQGTVSVAFATLDGGGGSAVAGADYLPTNGTLTFGPGVTSLSFSIPLLDDAVLESNETTMAALSNPGGGGVLGQPMEATVTIAENETCAYALIPTSRTLDAAGGPGSVQVNATGGCAWTATTSAGWIVLGSAVSGTGDGTVEYSVAPNPSTASRTATLQIGEAALRLTQQGVLPPDVTAPTVAILWPGANSRQTNGTLTVTGRAKDTRGVTLIEYQVENGSAVSEYALATGTTNWTVSLAGLKPGMTRVRVRARDAAGNLSAEAERVFRMVEVSPLTLQIDGNGSVSRLAHGQWLDVGQPYTVQARPASKHFFTGWTGSVTSRTNPITFTMQHDFVLQAHFVPTPFDAGTYHGLVSEETSLRHESSGFLTLTVTDMGLFTARLTVAGKRYSLRGYFDLEGRATNVVARAGASPLTVILALDLAGERDTLSGAVNDGTWVAPLTAFRHIIDPAAATQPTRRYTLISPGAVEAATTRPGGDSHGSLTLDRRNYVTLRATLADGTKVAQKVPVSKDGLWPFYVPLHGGRGSALSLIQFTNAPDGDFSGTLSWFKPPLATGRVYRNGFAVQQEISGSLFQRPLSGPLLNFSQGTATFNEGNPGTPFEIGIALSPNNRVTPADSRLRLTLSPSTGLFRGTVRLPGATRSVSFTGALHQKGNYGAGCFLGTDQSGQVRLAE